MTAIPLKIVLLSSQPLIAQSLCNLLNDFANPPDIVVKMVGFPHLTLRFGSADLVPKPDLILLPLSLSGNNFELVQTVRAAGCNNRFILICSAPRLPPLKHLIVGGIAGLLDTSLKVLEAEEAFYSAIRNEPNILAEQYRQMLAKAAQARSSLVSTAIAEVVQPTLNQRDKELLRLVAQDLTDAQIAQRLGLSKRTISNQLSQLFRQLKVRGRTGAVLTAMKHELLSFPEF